MGKAIDNHPERTQILADIAKGVSREKIAERYGLSRSTVERYVSDPAFKELQARTTEEVMRAGLERMVGDLIRLVNNLDGIHDALDQAIRNDAGEIEWNDKVDAAFQRLLQTQEVYGRQLQRMEKMGFGIVQSHERENVRQQADDLVDTVLGALEQYPEAREEVIDAIRHILNVTPAS